MEVFDASSIIYGWDNYPIQQFPKLWEWLATQVEGRQISISVVALSEVQAKTPDCGAWLRVNNVVQLPAGNAELVEALRIKALLGIVGVSITPMASARTTSSLSPHADCVASAWCRMKSVKR